MGKFAVCVYTAMFAAVMIFIRVSADPDSLQDICVADHTSAVKINGFPCKSSKPVAADFFFSGLNKSGNTNTTDGSVVTTGNVMNISGLNTLGVSLARIDFGPEGLNPPHTHPRATEIVFVLEGDLFVGFITTTDNVLVSKNITKGDVFVFPKGLVHFQQNMQKKKASVISAFNSQLPGTQSIAKTLFAANPEVPDNVLNKAFRVDQPQVVKNIKSKFASK